VPPLECIVVDDGSTDDSAGIAARWGARVLSTGGQSGPARARNIGAKAAHGDIVFFIDSDVCIHPDTLSQIFAEFVSDPALDAIMGSYDDSPSEQNFVSQYRNLMHHFVHQQANSQATTFWAGCGAMRRQVFLDFGGFDERYRSASIEDIEMGYRLFRAHRKLVLRAGVQVKHLKHWSLRGMMKADFFYRALPWSELTLRSGRLPNDLNLAISQRISVALVFILCCLAIYSTLRWGAYFLTPLVASFSFLLAHYWMEKQGSWLGKTLIAINAVLIVGFSWRFHMFAIIPMVLIACLALFVRHRYASKEGAWQRRTRLVIGAYILLVAGMVWIYFPWTPIGCVFLLLMLTLLVLNKQFYIFLAAKRQGGKLFALSAIPFHLLYFASCGLALTVALASHGWSKLQRHKPEMAGDGRADKEITADTEI
jgi:glycosyltransferase involved in cell wall biosynthesis